MKHSLYFCCFPTDCNFKIIFCKMMEFSQKMLTEFFWQNGNFEMMITKFMQQYHSTKIALIMKEILKSFR